ncbi:MAG: pentapeptide repeat-containing protein [Actinomycetia bacterium]|nr:pentapeptide repeat-containing protein [Actinomycetes bacterium]
MTDVGHMTQFEHPPLTSPVKEPDRPTGAQLAKSLRREAARLSGWHVLVPSGGLVALGIGMIAAGGTTLSAIGQAAITGAIVTGGFGWTEALSDVFRSERERQIDLGSAGQLSHADLAGLELRGMYLRHANLRGARLSRANALDADLHGANLIDARLTAATLRNADLTRANLTGAGCFRADFSSADLRGATLRGARLGDAKFVKSNLQGADLAGTDLRGADLLTAILGEAILDGAWISESTRLPAGMSRYCLPVEIHDEYHGSEEIVCDSCGPDVDLVAEEQRDAAERTPSAAGGEPLPTPGRSPTA